MSTLLVITKVRWQCYRHHHWVFQFHILFGLHILSLFSQYETVYPNKNCNLLDIWLQGLNPLILLHLQLPAAAAFNIIVIIATYIYVCVLVCVCERRGSYKIMTITLSKQGKLVTQINNYMDRWIKVWKFGKQLVTWSNSFRPICLGCPFSMLQIHQTQRQVQMKTSTV